MKTPQNLPNPKKYPTKMMPCFTVRGLIAELMKLPPELRLEGEGVLPVVFNAHLSNPVLVLEENDGTWDECSLQPTTEDCPEDCECAACYEMTKDGAEEE